MGEDRRAQERRDESLRGRFRGLLLFGMMVCVAGVAVLGIIAWTDRERAAAFSEAQRQAQIAINTSSCTFRAFFGESLARSREAVKDPTASAGTVKRNQDAISVYRRLIAATVTIPREFNCNEFLAGIVREQRAREQNPGN